MSNVIKLRKGLDLHLQGEAEQRKLQVVPTGLYGLVPDDFVGVTPKVLVREGDHVLAGEPLFANKQCPEVTFASPVSGTVKAVVRGERRKVLSVQLEADKEQQWKDFGPKDVSRLEGEQVVDALLEAGLFGYIDQLPYAVSTTPDAQPKAIFVSALRDKPLAADFQFEVKGQEEDFLLGLSALGRVAHVYLGVGALQADLLSAIQSRLPQNVEVAVFDGPCPAGNVGVQVNHLSPVNKGEVVWTIGDPSVVLFFGRLFRTGRVDLRRTVALCGSEVTGAAYADLLVGQQLTPLLMNGSVSEADAAEGRVRIIRGNVLTGRPCKADDFLGAHESEVTVIPEGNHADEMLGWIMPRLNQYSANRSYFSWLFGKKQYALDARVKGGERRIIMSGEYDRVLPMDIMGEFLVKAIITQDIDRMEQLGIYEVSPEDFALAEFVDSSKLELQRIVREGLDLLRKENA